METVSPSTAVTSVEDVGARLREAREHRGISVEQLARTIKIRPSLLGAIETNRRDALPTTIFVRGFVHAYAREVGLDADETSRAYLNQFAPPAVPAENAAAPAETPAPGDVRQLNWRRFRIVAAAVAAGIVLIAYTLVAHRGTPAPASSPAAVARVAQAAPSTAREVATSGSSTPSPVAAAGQVLHVDLVATGVCWVSANVDGTRVIYQLLQPGERRSLTVKEEMALRVGEPSAVTLTIDGAAARPLGAAGRPTTITVTPENYRDLLR